MRTLQLLALNQGVGNPGLTEQRDEHRYDQEDAIHAEVGGHEHPREYDDSGDPDSLTADLCDQIVAYAARERVPWPFRGLDRLVRIHVDLGGVKSGSLVTDGKRRLGQNFRGP